MRYFVSPQAECIAALEQQIAIEFQASLQYLLMAAHFSQVLMFFLAKCAFLGRINYT